MTHSGTRAVSYADMMLSFAQLQAIHTRRQPLEEALLASGTSFFRGLHTTETAGLFALDVAGNVGILSLYRELSAPQEQDLGQICQQLWGLHTVYLKRRPAEARHLANVARDRLSPPEPLLGPDVAELTVLESGVPYLIRPGADLSIGLFGDARPAREWVRQQATGLRVLNTFAYTCGFGLNAALGEASSSTNLDLSRKVLEWGEQNYALSHQTGPQHDFIYGDTFDWLGRLAKRQQQFELVILDPPSFARSKKGVWRSEHDYAKLMQAAAQVTAPGGMVLALCNHAGLTPSHFEQMLSQGAHQAGRNLSIQAILGAGADYPGAQHLKVRATVLR